MEVSTDVNTDKVGQSNIDIDTSKPTLQIGISINE